MNEQHGHVGGGPRRSFTPLGWTSPIARRGVFWITWVGMGLIAVMVAAQERPEAPQPPAASQPAASPAPAPQSKEAEPGVPPSSTVPPAPVAPPAPGEPPITVPPETVPPETVPPETVLREQTIYIPYTRLRDTFEREGRGVFLPYEKFQELWRAARSATTKREEAGPPVGALVTAIDSQATVERDVVRVTAKLQIELLAAGWHRIPLRLGDAAILSARLGDNAAHVTYEKDGYYVLLRAKPPEPNPMAPHPGPADFPVERRELVIEYAKAYVKHPGHNQVSIEAPQAPVNRWEIRVPQADTKITLEPLIAATEIKTGTLPLSPATRPQPEEKPAEKPAEKPGEKPSETPTSEPQPSDAPSPPPQTILQAFVGAAPTVKIDWTAKSEGAAGLASLVTVQARQLVRVDEGVVRTQTQLQYEISRADVAQLAIELPTDQRVINVLDANVQQWDVKTEGDTQRINVRLYQPTMGRQNLIVETEKFLSEMKSVELSAPVIRALNVDRQQGVVLVKLAPELRGEVMRRTGLTQLDVAELPQELAGQNWDLLFRYATLPFDLTLAVEKVQPRIQVDELVEVYLEPERMTAELLAVYQIERAGVFQLEINLPEGYELREVRGQQVGDAEPAVVDAHRREGEKQERLVVSLGRKALGKIGLVVRLERRLDDPNLTQPTGTASTFPLPVPRVVPTGIESEQGKLVVNVPESLRVFAQDQAGLRPVPAQEAFQPLGSQRAERFSLTRPVLSFAFAKADVQLTLGAERRRPAVTARQLLVARLEPGVAKYEATFHYDVRYSGVKSLRIDVPQDLAAKLHNETPAYRERALESPEPAPAEGYVAWSFSGETELLGPHTIKLTWELPLEELAIGASRDIAVPRLTPRDAELERAWGQVVVTKAETLDIHPTGTPRGLRPIDPQHDLMPGAAVADAARAFEFQADWELTLSMQRYQLEEIKRTAIELGLVRMVVTRSGSTAVQALYRVRSAHQRLAFKLPDGFQLDTQPLSVNGQRQDLERGEGNELFVPLVNRAAAEPVLLEIRYTVPRGAGQLDLPVFQDDPAVRQIYLAAYLPEEQALLGANGAWTEEFDWGWSPGQVPIPRSRIDDSLLIQRLTRDVALERPIGDDFPLDGQRYLFSSLQPAPPPAGSLSLVSLKRLWLRACVLAVLAALGWFGLRKPLQQRLVILLVLVGALVAAGAVLATFTRQIADGVLLGAIVVMLAAWMVRSTVVVLQQYQQARAEALQRRRAIAEAAALAHAQAAAQAAAQEASKVTSSTATTAGDSPFQTDDTREKGGADHA